MPYQTSDLPCKVCGTSGKLTRSKWSYQNSKYYLQSSCKDCERQQYLEYQKSNREYFKTYNRKQYLKKVGKLVRMSPLENTPEHEAQRRRNKSNARCGRAKKARRTDELTQFVTREAHELRKLRNTITGIEWHVDHIIPLKGKLVSGLHVWNNLAVIPKVENLRKGNKNSVHA